jgi:hypothetical protein
MDIEDILDEINYLKKKTVLLEKCINKKYNTNTNNTELNNYKPPPIIKKRTIC